MALEHINLLLRMTQFLVNQLKTFFAEPLLVIDVGARGGFEEHWQHYG